MRSPPFVVRSTVLAAATVDPLVAGCREAMVTRNSRGDSGRRTSRNGRGAAPRHPSADTHSTWQALQRAWTAVGRRVPQMRDSLSTLAAVQVDRIRARIANATGRLMFGSAAVLTLAAVTTVAATLVLLGVTGGLATALDGRLWLAALITGASALFCLLLVVLFAVHSRAHQRLAALHERYRRESSPTDEPESTTTTSPATDPHAH